jgi:hypothetical protein
MTDPIDEWLLKHVDERFYEAFPRDYFHDSLMLALAALQAPRRTLSVLTEDQFFRGSDDENVLQLRLDPDDLDEESYRKTAKLQIVNLYYHTLETFLRLFLAHRPGVDRPWLEMARETEFRKFKSKAAKLARISATWDGSHTEDEAFRLAFWPERSPDDQDARLLSAAKEWMRLAASETIDDPPTTRSSTASGSNQARSCLRGIRRARIRDRIATPSLCSRPMETPSFCCGGRRRRTDLDTGFVKPAGFGSRRRSPSPSSCTAGTSPHSLRLARHASSGATWSRSLCRPGVREMPSVTSTGSPASV